MHSDSLCKAFAYVRHDKCMHVVSCISCLRALGLLGCTGVLTFDGVLTFESVKAEVISQPSCQQGIQLSISDVVPLVIALRISC